MRFSLMRAYPFYRSHVRNIGLHWDTEHGFAFAVDLEPVMEYLVENIADLRAEMAGERYM